MRTESNEEVVVPDGVGPRPHSFYQRNRLKILIVGGDATAIAISYSLILFGGAYSSAYGRSRALMIVVAAAVAGVWSMRMQELYLSRVSTVRVVEITRTARAVTIMSGLVVLGDRLVHDNLMLRYVAMASILSLMLIGVSRSIFRSWLAHSRSNGSYTRRIAIVGTSDEAVRLLGIFTTHTELGMSVVGVIGDPDEAEAANLGVPWLGHIEDAATVVEAMDISGVVVSPTGLPAARLNGLIRTLHASGRHVHLATGVAGIDSRRLRSVPVAHEPLVYVEPPALRRTQLVAKRIFDVLVASVALICLSPVFAAIAVTIKLDDRGPVFFSQRRVGRGGSTFGVLKFRSMAIDAEQRLAQLTETNERQGPLFKMVKDPRVTRIGHFLRESSLDELPQLINVIRGEMSLVGPRPALPAEVLNFSDELRNREQVLPGITGLWQVEARDNPSFEAYRRLDLFYVENWSITLDLMIIVGTIEQTVSRLVRVAFSRSADAAAPAGVGSPANVELR